MKTHEPTKKQKTKKIRKRKKKPPKMRKIINYPPTKTDETKAKRAVVLLSLGIGIGYSF